MIARKLIKEKIIDFMYNNFQGNNRPHYNLKTSLHNKFFFYSLTYNWSVYYYFFLLLSGDAESALKINK